MSAKRITMLVPAAFPDVIYLKGKTYLIPEPLASELIAVGSGADEKSTAGKLAKKGTKLSKPQSPPDPGEQSEADDDSDDDDTPEG